MKAPKAIKFSLAASLLLMGVVAVIPVRSGHSQPTDTAKPAPAPTVPALAPAAAPTPPIREIQERVAEKAAQLKEANADRAKDAEAVKRGVETLNSSLDELAAATAKAKAAADSIAAAAGAEATPPAAPGPDAQDQADTLERRPAPGHWWLRIFGR